MHIRWLIRRDMPEVLEIERASFEFPWSETDFLRVLRQRECIGMVAQRDDRVVGFMTYALRPREIHLLNFAIHPKHRRSGVGQALIEKLAAKLTPQRRSTIRGIVRETNLPALLYFQSMGFVSSGLIKSAFPDSDEGAVVMQYELWPTADQVWEWALENSARS